MNNMFDTTPFAYVGNSKEYKELSKEELDNLKNKTEKNPMESHVLSKKLLDDMVKNGELEERPMTDPVEKEALPASDEVEESSASVVGPMLPQVGLTVTEEPDVDNVITDINEDAELLKEALDDTVNGADIYFEKTGFIDALKKRFKKDAKTAEVDNDAVARAAKAYSDLQIEKARLKVMLAKDPDVKNSPDYKEAQKKIIMLEKKFRELKKKANPEELKILNDFSRGFDTKYNKQMKNHIKDIKDAKKTALKTEYAEFADDDELFDILVESVNEDFYFEGVNLDIHKRYRADIKTAREKLRTVRKHLKNHEYNEAKDVLNTAIKTIQMCKINMLKNIEKIDDNKVITALCGFLLRNVTIICRDIIPMLLCAPVATVRSFIDGTKDLSNISKKYQEKGYFVPGDFNTYVNFVEKDYDRILYILKSFLSKIDDIEKKYREKEAEKETVKNESVEAECGNTELVTEKDLDPDMKPLLEKLHNKGYKTRSSSSGHKNVTIKKDGDKDNVVDSHFYGDARLVFDQKYNLGKAPKYWYWKKVDDDIDYLDVMQIAKDESPDTEDKFNNWKDKYMSSLTNWIDSLPDVSDNKKEEVEEACATESMVDVDAQIDILFESVMNDLEIDLFDL